MEDARLVLINQLDEGWAGDALLVAGNHGHGAGAVFLRVSEMAARAGIHAILLSSLPLRSDRRRFSLRWSRGTDISGAT